MLGGNAQVADVAEGVLAFAGVEEGGEGGFVGVLRLDGGGGEVVLLLWESVLGLRLLCILRRRGGEGGGVGGDGVGALVEAVLGTLLGEGGEGGCFADGVGLLGTLGGEGVVAACGLGRDGAGGGGGAPGVVGAGLGGGLLVLLLLAEAVLLRLRLLRLHLLRPGVVGVLGLQELLAGLLQLLEAGGLRLVVAEAAEVAVLELAGGLVVRVREVSGLRWLLHLDGVPIPIHLRLLRVSLIPAGCLRGLFCRRRVIK